MLIIVKDYPKTYISAMVSSVLSNLSRFKLSGGRTPPTFQEPTKSLFRGKKKKKQTYAVRT